MVVQSNYSDTHGYMTTDWSGQVENGRKMAWQNLGTRSARKEEPRKTLLLRASLAKISRSHFTLVLFSHHDDLLLLYSSILSMNWTTNMDKRTKEKLPR